MRTPERDSANEDVVQRIKRDVNAWQRSGIITSDQSDAILDYYGDNGSHHSRIFLYGRLSSMLAIMGAVFSGVGLVLLVGANWQDIPVSARIGMIIELIIATNGIGYYLRYRRGYVRAGEAILLLGCFAFGAGIVLVAQSYHYDADGSVLTLWWCLGVLPVAYLLALRSALGLALILFIVTFVWGVDDLLGGINYLTEFTAIVIALTSVFFAIGSSHRQWVGYQKFLGIYFALGTLAFLIALYLLSFEGFHQEEFHDVVQDRHGLVNFLPVVLLSCLGLLVYCAAYVFTYGINLGVREVFVRDTKFARDGVVVLYVIAIAIVAYWSSSLESSILWAAFFNLVFSITIVGIIIIGVADRKPYFVNMGLSFFGLLLVTRYFDLMWGMLNGALFFILGGVLLVVLALGLERVRRRLTITTTDRDD